MAFFTLIQEYGEGGTTDYERFISFEADSHAEAVERASWYGIDLSEKLGLDPEDPTDEGYSRWWWQCGLRSRPQPEVSGRLMQVLPNGRNSLSEAWVIVYKNDNIASSQAIPLDRERDF